MIRRVGALVAALLLLLLAGSTRAQAQAALTDRNGVTMRHSSFYAGNCTPPKVGIAYDTAATYRCPPGRTTWERADQPACLPDPPSGACSANAVCIGALGLYRCVSGTWQISGAGGGGGGGDMTKSIYDSNDDGTVNMAADAAALGTYAATQYPRKGIANTFTAEQTATVWSTTSAGYVYSPNFTWMDPNGSNDIASQNSSGTVSFDQQGVFSLMLFNVPVQFATQPVFSQTPVQAPFTLGTNQQGQVVTGLNADLLDGQTGTYYQTADTNLATLAGLACGTGQVAEWGATDWICGTDDNGGVGGTPGGANTQVQYNAAGAFAGDADFTFDGVNRVTATNLTVTNTIVGSVNGNAATATALAANPTDCTPVGGANAFATTIAASGNLTCSTLVDADIPDTITASNYQPLDTDLTTIAGLACSANQIQKWSGAAWACNADDDVPDAGEVDDTALAAGAVDGGAGGEIADASITTDDLANGAVTTPDLALGAVGPNALADIIFAGSCTNCNLTYDADGRITVATNGTGGGSVNLTGTPANNQLAVWTNSNTLEGDANLTYDAATNTLLVGGAGNGTRGMFLIDNSASNPTVSTGSTAFYGKDAQPWVRSGSGTAARLLKTLTASAAGVTMWSSSAACSSTCSDVGLTCSTAYALPGATTISGTPCADTTGTRMCLCY